MKQKIIFPAFFFSFLIVTAFSKKEMLVSPKKMMNIQGTINYSATNSFDTTYKNVIPGLVEDYKGKSTTTGTGQLILSGTWEVHEDLATHSILIAYNFDPANSTDVNYATGHGEINATGGYDEKSYSEFERRWGGLMNGGEHRTDLTSCHASDKVDIQIQIFQKNHDGLFSTFNINTEFKGTTTLSGDQWIRNPDQRQSNVGWFPIDDSIPTEIIKSVGASGSNNTGDNTMNVVATSTGYLFSGQYAETSSSGMMETTTYRFTLDYVK
jgi:hypothetical protein